MNQRRQEFRQRPPENEQDHTPACAKLVSHPTSDGVCKRVGNKKRGDDMAIADIANLKSSLDGRGENRKALAVKVVEHRGHEEQCHDPPAITQLASYGYIDG